MTITITDSVYMHEVCSVPRFAHMYGLHFHCTPVILSWQVLF